MPERLALRTSCLIDRVRSSFFVPRTKHTEPRLARCKNGGYRYPRRTELCLAARLCCVESSPTQDVYSWSYGFDVEDEKVEVT